MTVQGFSSAACRSAVLIPLLVASLAALRLDTTLEHHRSNSLGIVRQHQLVLIRRVILCFDVASDRTVDGMGNAGAGGGDGSTLRWSEGEAENDPRAEFPGAFAAFLASWRSR